MIYNIEYLNDLFEYFSIRQKKELLLIRICEIECDKSATLKQGCAKLDFNC